MHRRFGIECQVGYLWTVKILFIHGLASSGAYKMATMLRQLIRPVPEVIAPDFPVDPYEMTAMLERISADMEPDLTVGLSLGGFWAQKLKGRRKVLVNPSFHISGLLETMVGEVEYLSPRRDGATAFTITEDMVLRYKELENNQFQGISPQEAALTLGLFADRDERVRCGAEFALNYPGRAVSYHGGHLPTYPEMKFQIVPEIERFLQETL